MPRMIPRIQSNVISGIKEPITTVVTAPVIGEAKPPVVRGITSPVVDVPDPSFEYPTLDVPTEEEYQGVLTPEVPQTPEQPEPSTPDTRDLPNNPPPVNTQAPVAVIDVGGLDIPVPDPAPLVAAGSLAVVTTFVTLGSTIALNQLKGVVGRNVGKILKPQSTGSGKKKKIKIKQVKPVLHFIPNENGTVECIQYSAKGMKILEGGIEKFEQHLRDQVDLDGLWEYDNKLIIDEELSKQLTKEGQKRFKKYFAPPKVIAKKLGAKFSI